MTFGLVRDMNYVLADADREKKANKGHSTLGGKWTATKRPS